MLNTVDPIGRGELSTTVVTVVQRRLGMTHIYAIVT